MIILSDVQYLFWLLFKKNMFHSSIKIVWIIQYLKKRDRIVIIIIINGKICVGCITEILISDRRSSSGIVSLENRA